MTDDEEQGTPKARLKDFEEIAKRHGWSEFSAEPVEAFLARCLEEPKWRSPESAPRDRSEILALFAEEHILARFDGYWIDAQGSAHYEDQDLKGWFPVPE